MILQVNNDIIFAAQPIGQPEICKISRMEASAESTDELFIIGKNFMKGTKVFFQELSADEAQVVGSKEAESDKDYFQPVNTVQEHTVKPHLSGLFTYPDTCFGTDHQKVTHFSGNSVIWTVNLGTEVSG